jgi:T5SS/PEP-CTERM-associated repeat protein
MGNSGGNGELQVLAGGRVGTTLQTVIGLDATSQSTVTVSGTGSTLAVGTLLEVGRAGAGTLNISAGGNVTAAGVSVGNAGVLRVVDASMNGNLTLLPNSQMFADNATVGPLTQQAGADFNFTLRGTNDFDNLHVLGPAILQGDLFVTLGGGYTPQSGHSFEFLTATAGLDNANFSSLNLPTLSGGLNWLLHFNPQSLTLSVFGGIDGDFNNDGFYNCEDINALTGTIAAGTNAGSFDLTGDGLVNLADRDAWLSEAGEVNLGPGRVYKLGDANLDGVVDGSDFGIWNGTKFTTNTAWCSGNFNGDVVVDGSDFGIWNGNKFTSSDGISAVPEPSMLGGLLVVLCGLAIRRGVQ